TDGVLEGGLMQSALGHLQETSERAARQRRAEIRTEVKVRKVVIKNGVATGVILQNGDEIAATVVVSNADTKRTFFQLVEPTYLDPHFLLQVKNIRSRGTVAKVNFALAALPKFKCAPDHASSANLGGVIHIGPTLDYLERAADDAKYGRFSKQPFLEITIPSVADPSVAPAGKHVMSV